MDLSVAQTLRVVHRRSKGCREKRCHQRPRNSHIHHSILPQVRFADDHVGTCITRAHPTCVEQITKIIIVVIFNKY